MSVSTKSQSGFNSLLLNSDDEESFDRGHVVRPRSTSDGRHRVGPDPDREAGGRRPLGVGTAQLLSDHRGHRVSSDGLGL